MSLVAPSGSRKSQLFTISSKVEPSNQNLTKFTFLSTLSASLRCYAKKIENLKFAEGVNFEFKDSLKNNGTK